MFCKMNVIKTFSKLTGKLVLEPIFDKFADPHPPTLINKQFLVNFAKKFKNASLMKHLRATTYFI